MYELKGVCVRLCEDRSLYSACPISCPDDLVGLLRSEMETYDREHVMLVCLNVKNQPINVSTVAIGGLSGAGLRVADIYKTALLSNASRIMLAHNHPSGDPTPSRDDIEITKRIREAGELLGIQLLDHIVVGNDIYCSMQERGILND